VSNAIRTAVVSTACVASVAAAVLVGWIEPCCNVKSINARTRVVTVTEKATGCTYEFEAKEAKDLDGLKVGSAIALDVRQLPAPAEPAGTPSALGAKPAEPVSKPAEPVGKPAEPAGRPVRSLAGAASAAACGSNVPRNAKTKTLCKRMTGPNSWEYVTCP
jgi:hypothetical protein